MKKEYKFEGDCLELNINGICLCKQKVHGKEFDLNVNLNMEVSPEQLKELLKFEEGLSDEQFWEIILRKRRLK